MPTPRRTDTPATVGVLIRCTGAEVAEIEDLSLPGEPRASVARAGLALELDRRRDVLDNLVVEPLGDRRYRVSHGSWSAVAQYAPEQAASPYLDPEAPDAWTEHVAEQAVIRAWEGEG